jgi:hypothetical protein
MTRRGHNMALRVGLALVVCLTAAVWLFAADATVSVQILTAESLVSLGVPFDVTIRVANSGQSPLVTSPSALSSSALWSYLEIARGLPDGSDVVVSTDRALPTPLPPSQWAMRDGVLVAVSPAALLAPGEFVDLTLTNLLLYFPLLEPGQYRLGLTYEFPVYAETITDPAYGDTRLVVLGDESRVPPTVSPAIFTLGLPEEVAGDDVEWFRAARGRLLASRAVEEAVGAFAPPEGASAYIQACSQYWIGEAYALYDSYDGAAAAYEAVLTQFGESPFAVYAGRRLEEIAALEEAQSP